MRVLSYNLADKKVQYLINTDNVLGRLIRYIGDSELILEEDGFKCLVKYIVGQQISDKARETIWQRICATWGNLTPELMLSASDADLRGVGLSGNKVRYTKTLARSIIEGEIDFWKLQSLENKEIVDRLTLLHGIGQWTAEMYLIFSLGREDVLSKGDGTIKRTIQWMYGLHDLPSAKVVAEYFTDWIKYATIVSSYLWKAISLGLLQKSFDAVIP